MSTAITRARSTSVCAREGLTAIEAAIAVCGAWAERRDELAFEIDGVGVQVDRLDHPRRPEQDLPVSGVLQPRQEPLPAEPPRHPLDPEQLDVGEPRVARLLGELVGAGEVRRREPERGVVGVLMAPGREVVEHDPAGR